jgi:hypothetical protein
LNTWLLPVVVEVADQIPFQVLVVVVVVALVGILHLLLL